MNRHPIMGELAADDRLLDRLAAREDAGPDAAASMLAALARHADLPLMAPSPPRRFVRRRALTALTALVVGASGVGVAAATGPGSFWPRQSHRVPDAEAVLPRAAATVPAVPAPTLPSAGLATRGYALVRDAAGRISLAPPRLTVFEVPAGPGQPAYAASLLVDRAPSQSVRAEGHRPSPDEGPGVKGKTDVTKAGDTSPETRPKGNGGGGHPADDPETALTLSAIAAVASEPAGFPASAHVGSPPGQSGLEIHPKPKQVEAAAPHIPAQKGRPGTPETPAAPAKQVDVIEPRDAVKPADARDAPELTASRARIPAVPDRAPAPSPPRLQPLVAGLAGLTTP